MTGKAQGDPGGRNSGSISLVRATYEDGSCDNIPNPVTLAARATYTQDVFSSQRTTWAAGVWYHIAIVYTGTDLIIYGKGTQIAKKTFSSMMYQ